MRWVPLFMLVLCSGCALMISGTHEDALFESEPPGQKVIVDGKEYVMPARVPLKRSADHHAEFPNGTQITIGHSPFGNPWAWLDLLWIAPGVLPFFVVGIVDVVSGAGRDPEPDHLLYRNGYVYDLDNGEMIAGKRPAK